MQKALERKILRLPEVFRQTNRSVFRRAAHRMFRAVTLCAVFPTAAGVCSKDLFHILPFFAFIVSPEKTFRCKKTVR